MTKTRIISWNVAGMRACIKKGLWEFMKSDNADIYCLQETKVKIDQIPHTIDEPVGYNFYLNSAEKAGYSGVGTYTKQEPKSIILGNHDNDWDNEGRVVITKFDEFTLLNVYFPNGKRDLGRLDFKMKFYEYFLQYINNLRDSGEKVIFCGDVNTAHTEIDLTHPKNNHKTSGFLPMERAWIDKLVDNGWIDTFREFNQEPEHYTWWDQISRARDRNVGWRIDYFFIDKSLRKNLTNAFILPDVYGSDHCPVGIEINI